MFLWPEYPAAEDLVGEATHSEVLQHPLTWIKKRGVFWPNVALGWLGMMLAVAGGRMKVVALRVSTARLGALASGRPATYVGVKRYLSTAGKEEWNQMASYCCMLRKDDVLVLPAGWMYAIRVETKVACAMQFPIAPACVQSADELDVFADIMDDLNEASVSAIVRLQEFSGMMRLRVLGARISDDMEEMD